MKYLFVFFAFMLILLTSCTKTLEQAVSSDNSQKNGNDTANVSNTSINQNSPIIIYVENDFTIIGGSRNGSFNSIYDYYYNNKELEDLYNINSNRTEVDCELLKQNDLIVFYDINAESYNVICDNVELVFVHSTPHLIPNMKNELEISVNKAIGISCDWEVFPRKPVFNGNTAVVDIDGNGVMDEIRWEFSQCDESGVDETKLIINYNGKEYVRQATTPLYIREYSVLNIMDLNGNGKLEIVEYTYDYGVKYTILGISEEGFIEYISYGYGDY